MSCDHDCANCSGSSIEKSVKEIIAKQFDLDVSSLTLQTDIAKDVAADSLDVVDLVGTLEEEFNLKIPDSEIQNMKTINDIVTYVSQNQSN